MFVLKAKKLFPPVLTPLAVVSGKALCSSFIDSTDVPWIILILSSRMYVANGSSMWSIELRLLIDRPTCVKKHACVHGARGIRCASGSLYHSLRKFNKEMYKLYEATSFSCLFSIIHNKSWHCVHRVHFIMRDKSRVFHMYMAHLS